MSKPVKIIEVWNYNLLNEMKRISSILKEFSFVSMDTEFPGAVYRPFDKTLIPKLSPFHLYHVLKGNVDILKLIQVGLTLSDADGNLPDFGTDYCYIWQFNFRDFDITRDYHALDSIELLQKQGIDFNKNRDLGISSMDFAFLLVKSRLVLNPNVTWITFHSAYDFGYLIKILTGRVLPTQLGNFIKLLHYFFGFRVYDIKSIMKYCESLYGGLEKVAKTLEVKREVGNCHQAGSDSLLTLKTFMKMKEKFFVGNDIYLKYAGIISGF